MNMYYKKYRSRQTTSRMRQYRKTVLTKLFALCISIFMVNIAVAIPPTPPIRLEFQAPNEIENLKPKSGGFKVPVEIHANRYVENSKLVVRTLTMGNIGQRKAQTKEYNIRALQKGDVYSTKVKLPVQDKNGLYRIEMALKMKHFKDYATVNKQVLIQQISAGKAKLMTPAALRHKQVASKEQKFWKTVAKNRPNIKKLADQLQPVAKTSLGNIKPHAFKKHKKAGAGELPEDIKPYLLDKANQSGAGNQNSGFQSQISSASILPLPRTQAKGTVVFEDFYTNLTCNPFDVNDPYYPCKGPLPPVITPLANATVVLVVDNPSGFDFSLGVTVTDEDGDWAIDFDPSFLGSDFYYTVNLDNADFTVRDDNDDTYIWTSDTLLAGPGPFYANTVNFGQQTMTDNVEAAQVFNIINIGWNHIVNQGGADPVNLVKLEVRYPSACIIDGSPSSCWDVSDEIIRIEAYVNDGPDVILHEYGHALQFYAFSGNPVAGGPHSFDDVTQPTNVAYGEGWATAFAMSVCPDGYFTWAEGAYEDVDEWPACNIEYDFSEWIEGFRYPTATANRDGESHEGRVAATLFDFMDEPNDDNGGTESRGKNNYEDANENDQITLETIFGDHMWGYDFNSITSYYIHLRTGLTTTQQDLADDIMTYNWMDWPITIPWPETLCVASKVAMALSPDYADVLKGLRLFRDKLMKPLVKGRKWIQSYYSHSPEMAMLLIKNGKVRAAAKTLVEHFSEIGYKLDDPDGLGNLAHSQERVLPQKVLRSINTIANVINTKGSNQLKQKLAEMRNFIKPFRTMSMSQAADRVEGMSKVQPGSDALTIDPLKFAPGSKNANWELIYKNMPASEKPD